ncbi:MAG TPA: OsmC family peroxiredoxin [Nocardioides sp.]|nr:OsmC family peroxiredoxin [Nocardioides sp.]
MAEGSPLAVRATAGSLRAAEGLPVPHAWTSEGIVADAQGTGAHLLHLSVAVCVLNDTYREADRRGLPVAGVEVVADGGFDDSWASTGITYRLRVDSPATDEEIAGLVRVVDEVAEIPRALRAGAAVARSS